MTEEFREELLDAVKEAVSMLNDEEALAIVKICKQAVNREIAEITERYLEESIRGGEAE